MSECVYLICYMHLFPMTKLICTFQSVHWCVLACLLTIYQFSAEKNPTFFHCWRTTLELWPHLDSEHLWSANNYPISAKRGCSYSPRGALIPAHTSCTTASPPNNPSILQTALVSLPHLKLGSVLEVWWQSEGERGGSWGSMVFSWLTKLRQKGPSLPETEGPAHTHLDGQGNHKKACSASKPLCHLGS